MPSKANDRYGYLWGLRGDGTYAASGIFGRQIHIDPKTAIVIVLHSARDDANNAEDWRLMHAAFAALVSATLSTGDEYE